MNMVKEKNDKKEKLIITDNKKIKKREQSIKNKREFINIIKDLLNNEKVLEMDKYKQHFDTTCFKHCLEVSYISYIICKKLGLDYVSVARGGMLHDLFLYDWRLPHDNYGVKGKHAFSHPTIALMNASKIFDLNDIEKDIILNHMWPVTIYRLPKYKETWIVTVVDKLNALNSCYKYYKVRIQNGKNKLLQAVHKRKLLSN